MATTIEDALTQLKTDPTRPVQVEVDGLTIEIRAVEQPPRGKSVADILAEIGPWEGETTEEIMAILREARREGGQRQVPDL